MSKRNPARTGSADVRGYGLSALQALAPLIAIALLVAPGCRKKGTGENEAAQSAKAAAEPGPPPSAPGTFGPLGADCYDVSSAAACPPDPSDPSGHKLPAHGGPCKLPVCRPCGSKKVLAFRDEHGAPSAGYCICVPQSDDSGRGTFSCYSVDAWKKRQQ